MKLKPISFSGGVKSISDDDLCATCRSCQYRPGDMSGCRKEWPGMEDDDGYVQECEQFERVAVVGENKGLVTQRGFQGAEMQKQPDWQAVALAVNFTEEVDCNSGARRIVFADGRIKPLQGNLLADEEELPPEAAQAIKKAIDLA